MNTFLPLADFRKSAEVLDPRRLNKQRLEVVQMLDALHELTPAEGGWAPKSVASHPATLMWRGHEPALAEYGLTMCEVWIERGYHSSHKCEDRLRFHLDAATSGEFSMEKPYWFGEVNFHLMHQAVLLRKDPAWYRQYFSDADDTIKAFYPAPPVLRTIRD